MSGRCVRVWGIVALLAAGKAWAVPVVVDSWSLTTQAADYVGTNRIINGVSETVVELPFSRTTTRSYGQSTATSTYSFEVTEAGATFVFDFDQVRGGHGPTEQHPEGAAAYSWGRVYFHVTDILTYSVSGEYAMTGTNGLSVNVALIGPGQVELFANDQVSRTVPAESFVVGELGGADYNSLLGSPTGLLLPGKSYALAYHYYLVAGASDSGASAAGSLRFALAPEPTSSLFALVAAAVACDARRRRRCPA